MSASADKSGLSPPGEPIVVPSTPSDDRIYLIQMTWPLTSEELGHITRRRSLWSEFGAVLVIFSVGHLLQFVMKFVEDPAMTGGWLNASSKGGAIILVVGLALLGVGYFVAGERREILNKMKLQFKSNPGERRRIQ